MPRWTERSRQAQRERIREQNPWLLSTGPRTRHGRCMSSRNARGPHKRRCQDKASIPAPEPLVKGDLCRYLGYLPILGDCQGSLTVVRFGEHGEIGLRTSGGGGFLIWLPNAHHLERIEDAQMDR